MVLPMPELRACRLRHAAWQRIQHPHLGRVPQSLHVAGCNGSACYAPSDVALGVQEGAAGDTGRAATLHQPRQGESAACMACLF